MSSCSRSPTWAPCRPCSQPSITPPAPSTTGSGGAAVVGVELGAVLAADADVVDDHHVAVARLWPAARRDLGDDELGRRLARGCGLPEPTPARACRRPRVVRNGSSPRIRSSALRSSWRSRRVRRRTGAVVVAAARGDGDQADGDDGGKGRGRIGATLSAAAPDVPTRLATDAPRDDIGRAWRPRRRGRHRPGTPRRRGSTRTAGSGGERDDLVLHRHDDRRRHVDLAQPVVGAEAAEARPASSIIRQSCADACCDRPRVPRARLALEVELVAEPAVRLSRRQPGERRRARSRPRNDSRSLRSTLKCAAVAREHQPGAAGRGGDARGAGRRRRPSSSRAATNRSSPIASAMRDDVVGAVLEPERRAAADARAVAPVVERQHPEVLGRARRSSGRS